MNDESFWVNRAQTAEAQLKTLREAQGAAIERIKDFKTNFGIKERSNGEIVIDFPKFVERLGLDGAAELRKFIDEKYPVVVAPKRKYVRKAKPSEELHS
jgi:hypothetical protein